MDEYPSQPRYLHYPSFDLHLPVESNPQSSLFSDLSRIGSTKLLQFVRNLQFHRSMTSLRVSMSVVSQRSRVSSSMTNGRTFNTMVFKANNIVASKISITMCFKGRCASTPNSGAHASPKYTEHQPENFIDEPMKSDPTMVPTEANEWSDTHVDDDGASQQRKSAKIHDFCLGIPFGGIVFVSGLVGYIISRHPATLTTGMLSGGAIMALGVFSLKFWRKGLSSLPFILGQAAIAVSLIWKHFQSYSLTKKFFPSGFHIFMSGAMLCFYLYVLLAGGNPPPKKKLATTTSVA